MKRLTAIEENGNTFYPYCFREDTCFGAGESKKCTECDFAKKVCETLAAYENTGLTPSQILEMKERDTAKRYVKQKCQECIFLDKKTTGKRGGIRGYCRLRYPNEQRAGSSTACRFFEKDYEEE